MKRTNKHCVIGKLGILLTAVGVIGVILTAKIIMRDYADGLFGPGAQDLPAFYFDTREDQMLFYLMMISASLGLALGGIWNIITGIREY